MGSNATRHGRSTSRARGSTLSLALGLTVVFALLGSVRVVSAGDSGPQLRGAAPARPRSTSPVDVPTLQPLIATGGNWMAQGPAPIQNGGVDGIADGPVSGAVHAIAAHPTNADILYVGAANGGIWKTVNATAAGAPTWVAQTDALGSPSIGALEFDPLDGTRNTLVAGAGRWSNYGAEGGATGLVYRTTDGGASWAEIRPPLLAGQNISAVAARGATLVVASNDGGLSRSTDTGATWTALSGDAGSMLPAGGVTDMVGDPTRPTWLYAAVRNLGIFLSMDSGATWPFNLTVGNARLNARITDPASNNIEMSVGANGRIYVGVLVNDQPTWIGYSGGDTIWTEMDLPSTPPAFGGQFRPITDASNAAPIVITSANHQVPTERQFDIAVSGVQGNTAANGLWKVTVIDADRFSLNGSAGNGAFTGAAGGGWRPAIGTNPRPRPGGQGSTNFFITGDLLRPETVYVGGDTQWDDGDPMNGGWPNYVGASNYTGRLFRGDSMRVGMIGTSPSPQWDHLTHSNAIATIPMGGTASGSAPHADSREGVMAANGRLIVSDDGGVFWRTSPQDNTGDWFSLNGNLQVTEIHDIAYDSNANVLVAGTQDNGVAYQMATGSPVWTENGRGGDGGDVKVDDSTAGMSIRYWSTQNLGGFERATFDAANQESGLREDILLTPVGGAPALMPQFVNPIELNAIAPQRLVIGAANGVYESMDRGDTVSLVDAAVVANEGEGDAIAYGGASGGVANPDVLYVGSALSLFIRTAAGGALQESMSYPGRNGQDSVRGVVLDPADWRSAYVCDNRAVYHTADAGVTWMPITGNLATLSGRFHVLEYVPSADGVDGLVVGTTNGVFVMMTNAVGTWQRLGQGLPNVLVFDMDYDAADDVLAVGTLGRGAFALTPVAGQMTAPLTLTCPQGIQVQECNAPGMPTGGWVGTLGGLNVTGPAGAFPLSLRVSGIAGVAAVDVPGHVVAAGAWQVPFGTAPFPRVPVGMHTVTLTLTGQNGETGTCDVMMSVRDTTAPMLMCPMDVTVPATGAMGAMVNYAAPVVMDNCDMGIVPVCSPASGTVFPVGNTTVTCTAMDASGNMAMCTFRVTVTGADTQAPVVTCPPNVTVPATGIGGAVVNYPAPMVTDNVDVGLVAVCVPPSASLFPVGTTTVTCTATDAAGNVGMCTFMVTVTRDTVPPVVTCPPNVTVPATGIGGAVVNYPAPMVTDNVDMGLGAVCVPPSASLFPVGTTTVTCTATDAAGNVGMCTFMVTVTRDTVPPVVTCPPNVTVPGTGIGGAVVNYPAPMVTDNVDMGLVAVCAPPSASLFPFGTTTVTCTATDAAGNVGRCTFTVTVSILIDTQAPVVTCPPNVTVMATGIGGRVVNYPAPTVTDNVDVGLVALCVPASGSLFPIGTTTVTCTATDAADNTGRCTFTVTVTAMPDTQAPVVTCPANVTVVATVPNGAMVVYPAPTVTDNVDVGLVAVCVPASGSLFPIGTTTVTCTATDAAGNTGRCTFAVTVTAMPDTQAPVVTCPANVTVVATVPNGAMVVYPAPTVTDNVDVGLVARCVPASGSPFPVGTTTVTCTAMDRAGNEGRCTFTVTVTPLVTACQGPLRSATIETDVFVGDTPAIDLSVQLRQGFRFDSPVTDMVALNYTGAFPGPMAGLQDVLRVESVTVTNGVARVVLTVTADAMTFPGGSFGDALRRLDVVVNGRRNVGIARFNADELRREAWFSWNPRCGDRPDCANPQPIDPAANCPPRFAPRFHVTASTRAP